MYILKIIGMIFCGMVTFMGIIVTFFSSEGDDRVVNLIITFIFFALTALLANNIRKWRHKEGDKYFAAKQQMADEYYANRISQTDRESLEKQKAAQNQLESLKHEIDELNAEIGKLVEEKDHLRAELKELEDETCVQATCVEDYGELRSDEIKNKLSVLRVEQNAMVKSGTAVVLVGCFDNPKAANTQTKQILRCFNSECANIVGEVTAKNADISRGKIQRSFNAINKIFLSDMIQISQAYLESKLQELSLVYACMVKEEEEREQRKAIREQMMEEEKVRREIEREKQKIAKEEAQFTNEINKLMSYMQQAKDDVEKKLYIAKIQELEAKLKALEEDKESVLQREQNTRAGFVYIISNIGSFGEQVFKIGMTRRLEPMDRIAELSSASVPFPFDVHAMIFSEDAPGLEAILHQHFDKNRVNRINPRKEFFRVNIEEIKKVVLDNYNATVKFVDVPDALEYRETIRLACDSL